MTASNLPSFMVFRIRMDTVEGWFLDRLVAVFDRKRLRDWLAAPSRWFAEGEVVFAVDPRPSGDRVTIELPEVPAWTLTAAELDRLRDRV